MRLSLAVTLLLIAACGGEKKDASAYKLSSEPVSVRGWITDVAGAKRAETMELEIARRTELFAAASVWVEETQYASGGIAGNGAFLILDVPPRSATIGFNVAGAPNARVVLQNVPGNADVFIPNIVLENGGAKVLDPKAILVRVPASVDKPQPSGKSATVAGHVVPIINTPIHQLIDRREYPSPAGFRPVAMVK